MKALQFVGFGLVQLAQSEISNIDVPWGRNVWCKHLPVAWSTAISAMRSLGILGFLGFGDPQVIMGKPIMVIREDWLMTWGTSIKKPNTWLAKVDVVILPNNVRYLGSLGTVVSILFSIVAYFLHVFPVFLIFFLCFNRFVHVFRIFPCFFSLVFLIPSIWAEQKAHPETPLVAASASCCCDSSPAVPGTWELGFGESLPKL